MPRPTDTYDTSVVDLIESPKCCRSAGSGLTRGDHGHPVAVLERQTGIGEQRGIAAAHFDDLRVDAVRETASGRSGRRSARLARRRTRRCPVRCDRWRRCPDSTRPSCCGPGRARRAHRTATGRLRRRAESADRAACWCVPAERPRCARRAAGRPSLRRASMPGLLVGQHDLDGGGRRRRRRQPGVTSREKTKMQRMGTMMPTG